MWYKWTEKVKETKTGVTWLILWLLISLSSTCCFNFTTIKSIDYKTQDKNNFQILFMISHISWFFSPNTDSTYDEHFFFFWTENSKNYVVEYYLLLNFIMCSIWQWRNQFLDDSCTSINIYLIGLFWKYIPHTTFL